MQNSKKKCVGTHLFRPQYFGPYLKIQITVLYFVLPQVWGFQQNMSHSCRTKTQGGNRFSDLRPHPNITCMKLDWSWNLHQDLFISSKVISLFNPDRHTDLQTYRHTDIQTYRHIRHSDKKRPTLPSIYRWVKFLVPFLITFSLLCLLCSIHSWRIIALFVLNWPVRDIGQMKLFKFFKKVSENTVVLLSIF